MVKEADKRTRMVSFRLSEKTLDRIDADAEKLGISRSEYLVQLCEKGRNPSVLVDESEEISDLYYCLQENRVIVLHLVSTLDRVSYLVKKTSDNTNQIAKALNRLAKVGPRTVSLADLEVLAKATFPATVETHAHVRATALQVRQIFTPYLSQEP
jgi:predicted DNA-binding protein